VVPHQANLRIIRAMQERLELDDSKVMINIDRYGNTTAATIPLGLRDAVEQKRLKERRFGFAGLRGRGLHHRRHSAPLGVLNVTGRGGWTDSEPQ
jgi:3-oxoacyl-[acyl-carrier-protein] synthase-3